MMQNTQVLRLSDDVDGREQFFSSRNAAQQLTAATTTAKKAHSVMRGVQTHRKNESFNVFPVQQTAVHRTLQARKHSVGVTSNTRKGAAGLLDI